MAWVVSGFAVVILVVALVMALVGRTSSRHSKGKLLADLRQQGAAAAREGRYADAVLKYDELLRLAEGLEDTDRDIRRLADQAREDKAQAEKARSVQEHLGRLRELEERARQAVASGDLAAAVVLYDAIIASVRKTDSPPRELTDLLAHAASARASAQARLDDLRRKAAEQAKASRRRTPAEIIAACEKSITVIRTAEGTGSGFLVARNVVATNFHVVRRSFADSIEVTFPSANGAKSSVASVLHEDPFGDLCLLEAKSDLPSLPIAATHQFARGEEVIIIGSPGLGRLTIENAVTRGLLSTEMVMDGTKFYQIGASINPGNSGGPVLNMQGQVIGMACSKAAEQEGICFAVPAPRIAKAIASVRAANPGQLRQTNELHRARVLMFRLAVDGFTYAAVMETYRRSMWDALVKGGSADTGLTVARNDDQTKTVLGRTYLGRDAAALQKHLQYIQGSDALDPDCKRNLRELWACARELQGYVDHPRGTYSSYAQKARELSDNFQRVCDLLVIQLHARPPKEGH